MVSKFNNSKQTTSFIRHKNLQDIRIWNKIRDNGYEWAAIRLCHGFSYLCQSFPIRVSLLQERICNSYNPDTLVGIDDKLIYLTRCRADYLDWADNCEKHNISHHAAIDILFFGRHCREVEKIYRHRHGWAINNLMQSFEFYRK